MNLSDYSDLGGIYEWMEIVQTNISRLKGLVDICEGPPHDCRHSYVAFFREAPGEGQPWKHVVIRQAVESADPGYHGEGARAFKAVSDFFKSIDVTPKRVDASAGSPAASAAMSPHELDKMPQELRHLYWLQSLWQFVSG